MMNSLEWIFERCRRAIFSLENILYPDQCIGCKKPSVLLCESCIETLPQSDPPPKGASALAYRNHITRKAIWLLKYGGRKELASTLGTILAEIVLSHLEEEAPLANRHMFVLTAIPLSAKRLRKRGYNQSELLAQTVSFSLDIPYAVGLTKIRETPTQMSLPRKERLSNLSGAFTADPDIVRNKIVILIDDITTTGSTLKTATAALREAGAKKVLSFALAH